MFVHYRTQGFIIKKEDRDEADQLFTIYTRDFGKLEILGRSIRKISSKLRSGADIFYLSEIEFIQGKTHKTLTDAIRVEKFQNLRKDLKRLAIAYKISEVLDNLVKDQEPDEKIWQLLNETFQKLNILNLKSERSPLGRQGGGRVVVFNLSYYYFLWNLLAILGYKLELYNCPLCQKKLVPKKLYFSLKGGGIICQNCFKKLKSGKEVDSEIVKILRIILEKNQPLLSKLRLEKTHLQALKTISDEYLSSILDKDYS